MSDFFNFLLDYFGCSSFDELLKHIMFMFGLLVLLLICISTISNLYKD